MDRWGLIDKLYHSFVCSDQFILPKLSPPQFGFGIVGVSANNVCGSIPRIVHATVMDNDDGSQVIEDLGSGVTPLDLNLHHLEDVEILWLGPVKFTLNKGSGIEFGLEIHFTILFLFRIRTLNVLSA